MAGEISADEFEREILAIHRQMDKLANDIPVTRFPVPPQNVAMDELKRNVEALIHKQAEQAIIIRRLTNTVEGLVAVALE